MTTRRDGPHARATSAPIRRDLWRRARDAVRGGERRDKREIKKAARVCADEADGADEEEYRLREYGA